jgi:hypothetical protein
MNNVQNFNTTNTMNNAVFIVTAVKISNLTTNTNFTTLVLDDRDIYHRQKVLK